MHRICAESEAFCQCQCQQQPCHAGRLYRGRVCICCTVGRAGASPDARITLRAIYPNLMRYAVENSRTTAELDVSSTQSVEGRDPLDLFGEFFEAQNGTPPTEKHLDLMREILKEAEVTP